MSTPPVDNSTMLTKALIAKLCCLTILGSCVILATVPADQLIELSKPECLTSTVCVFTLKKDGTKIPVTMTGYEVPLKHGRCFREEWLGRQTARHVRRLLESAKVITLTRVYKLDDNPMYYGWVTIDGKGLADALIENGLAAEHGANKDWCEYPEYPEMEVSPDYPDMEV